MAITLKDIETIFMTIKRECKMQDLCSNCDFNKFCLAEYEYLTDKEIKEISRCVKDKIMEEE